MTGGKWHFRECRNRLSPVISSLYTTGRSLVLGFLFRGARGNGVDNKDALAEESVMLRTLHLLLFTFLPACLSLPAADEKAEAAKQLDKRWNGIAELKPRLGVRDLFAFALEAVANDHHPEHVERALQLAAQMQDRDPKNRTYGNFRWYWGDEKPDDLNAAEFCMQQGVLIWMFYFAAVAPRSKVIAEEVELAVDGLSGSLRLVADVGKGQRRAIEGGEQPPAGLLLSVNGKEYAREILKEVQPGH